MEMDWSVVEKYKWVKKGNLQNTLIYRPETVYQDYMGVIVTASVNISTGTILVDHSYTAT